MTRHISLCSYTCTQTHIPDVANVGYGFDALHVPKTEAGTLTDDPVRVLEQRNEGVSHTLIRGARSAKRNGSNGPHIGVLISQ